MMVMLIMLMTVLNIEPWQEHSLKMSSTSDAYSLSVINFQNLAKAYLFFKKMSVQLKCSMTYAVGQLCIITMVSALMTIQLHTPSALYIQPQFGT